MPIMSPTPIVNNSEVIKVMGTSLSVIDQCDICSNYSIMAENIVKSLEFQLDYCFQLSVLSLNTPIDESVLRLVSNDGILAVTSLNH